VVSATVDESSGCLSDAVDRCARHGLLLPEEGRGFPDQHPVRKRSPERDGCLAAQRAGASGAQPKHGYLSIARFRKFGGNGQVLEPLWAAAVSTRLNLHGRACLRIADLDSGAVAENDLAVRPPVVPGAGRSWLATRRRGGGAEGSTGRKPEHGSESSRCCQSAETSTQLDLLP
jgi:hypothetical protein